MMQLMHREQLCHVLHHADQHEPRLIAEGRRWPWVLWWRVVEPLEQDSRGGKGGRKEGEMKEAKVYHITYN